LRAHGFDISVGSIVTGLAKVDWPGRFQILNRSPLVLVDGAHNVASMTRLAWNVKKYFHYERLFVIFGVSVDKDIDGIVRELASLSPQVIVTPSSHPRAAFPGDIAAKFSEQGFNPQIAENVFQALTLALSVARDNDLILVTGSLFVVTEALDYAAKYLPKAG